MRRRSIPRFVTRAALISLVCLTACRAAPKDEGPRESARARPNVPVDSTQSAGHDSGSPILPLLLLDLDHKPVAKGRETPGTLSIIEEHDGTLADLQYDAGALQSRISIELHGDSSATLAKKSYQIELVDDARKDRDLPLLGLPPGSDWVLHNCGFDPSCLRNVLVFDLGRELGHYEPRTRFVELFVDEQYQGLYVLMERVRRDKDRVDLRRPARTEADGDISGGYIFRMNLGEGTPADRIPRDWVSPASGMVYSYHYPRFNEITSAQKDYLRDHMARFEQVMRGSRWNDPDEGYRRWLDVPSWVDFALIQELSLNPDAYVKSVYLQKWPRSKGDKIAIGPFWDFDLAFGVAEFRDARNLHAWAHTMNRFGAESVPYDPPGKVPYVPQYWERLWSDAGFRRDLQCRWQELRTGPLRIEALNAKIDGWTKQLATALPRDAARWNEARKNSHQGAGESLKQFLATRIAWMDANLPGRCAA